MQQAGRENDWGSAGCTESERGREKRRGRHVEEDQTGQKSDGKMMREMGGWGAGGDGSEGFFEDGEKGEVKKEVLLPKRRGRQRASKASPTRQSGSGTVS